MNEDIKQSFANSEVLEFYKELPFNYRESIEESSKAVKATNQLKNYPVLLPLLKRGTRLLDVGCGAGWFSNSASYHYPVEVTGIDFNPVALERGAAVAKALKLKTRFEHADLFRYLPEPAFDLVVSLGVLHHTDNCQAAVSHVLNHCVKPGGYAFIGLYHLHGRRPFLEHFAQLREKGASDEQLFERYSELHRNTGDRTHRYSWFRDQVLHPHETQHTLAQMLPLISQANMQLVSTSINRFEPISSIPRLLDLELGYAEMGQQRLKENQYFPGFFVFLAHKALTPV